MESAGQTSNALLVRAVEIGGGYPAQNVVARHEVNRSVVKTEQPKTFQDLGPFDKDLAKFTNTQAQRRFDQRQPLLSAAIHLSLNDIRRAIQKLLLSNNTEFAFVLAKNFDKGSVDHICTILMDKTVNLG